MKTTISYSCSRCERLYLVVGEGVASEARQCTCGGELREDELRPGFYEVTASAVVSAPVAEPAAKPDEPGPPLRQEADVGYGKSHGYGPGHGGPTGPGDAPAE